MKLIVGLGNPGVSYKRTYHNVGFLAVDKLMEMCGVSGPQKSEGKALTVHSILGGQKVVIAKPQTFMNNSGESVLSLKSKYKIDNSDIFIIYDDIDLDKGVVRYRQNGSAGTHNGMRSIVSAIGQDVQRIRIGISRNSQMDLADYVLSRIDDQSFEIIEAGIEQAVKMLLEKIAND